MPDYLADKYADVTDALLEEVEARTRGWRGTTLGRILGDCHRGNILWTDAGPHFVDLDDCVTGPAIQDLWMLLAGGAAEMRAQLTDLLEGYEQFLPFNRREIAMIEPLARTAHDPLCRLAGEALARSGVSQSVSLVRGAALLGGTPPGARRSAGGGPRTPARVVKAARIWGSWRAMKLRVLTLLCGRRDCGCNRDSSDVPAAKPQPKVRAPTVAVPHGPTPQELTAGMVEASTQGKSQTPVSVKFDLRQRPVQGEPLEIALAVLPQSPGEPGERRCQRVRRAPAGAG